MDYRTGSSAADVLRTLSTFSGRNHREYPFHVWLDEFERVAEMLGWTSEQKCVELAIRLKNEASIRFGKLAPEVRKTWYRLREALLAVYPRARQSGSMQRRLFKERKQRRGETITE